MGNFLKLGWRHPTTTPESESKEKESTSSTVKSSKVMIIIEPFESEVVIFTKLKDLIAHFKEMNIPSDMIPEGAQGFVSPIEHLGGLALYMFLPRKFDAGIIYHEALHLAHILITHHGMDVDETMNSSEMQAYLQEYIVRVIKREVYGRKK